MVIIWSLLIALDFGWTLDRMHWVKKRDLVAQRGKLASRRFYWIVSWAWMRWEVVSHCPSGYGSEVKITRRGRCMRFGRQSWRSRDSVLLYRQETLMQRNLVSLAYSTVFRVLALSFWDSPNQTHGCREFPLGQHVAPTFRGAPVMYPLVLRLPRVLIFSCSSFVPIRPLLEAITLRRLPACSVFLLFLLITWFLQEASRSSNSRSVCRPHPAPFNTAVTSAGHSLPGYVVERLRWPRVSLFRILPGLK